MAQDVQGMLVRIEATTAQLRREMENADKTVGNATKNIDGQLSRADKAFDRLNNAASTSLSKIVGNFNLLSVAVKAATAAMAGFSLASALSEQEKLQRNMLRTEAVITATGRAAGFTAKELHEQARQLALATLQSTEGVMEAQQVLLSYSSISGDVFTRAIETATDLATLIGGPLNGSLEMLAKTLDDPIRGINAMRRQGIYFTESQQEVIKSLVETNRLAEAQGLILDELAGQFGGIARKEAEGLAGAQDTLGQRIQETKLALADQLDLTGKAAAGYNAMAEVVLKLGNNMELLVRGGEVLAVLIGGRLVAAAGSAAAAFIAAQVQAVRYQAALASMAGVSRTAAAAMTASAVAARAASGAMALLGGPVGAAIVAASAVAYFATRSSEAEREADALDARIQQLDGSFQSLSANQAAAAILDYETKLSSANMTAEAAAAKVFTLNDNISRFPGSPKQEQWREELIRANAALDTANQVVDGHREKIAQLTAVIDQNTTSRQGNNLANLAGIEAGEKYLKQLETQLNRMKDKTAVQAAERVLTGNQIDRQSELGQKILATAAAQDAQREADAKLTGSIKTGNKALDDRIKAIDALRDKYNPAAKAQAEYEKGIELADKALRDGTYTTEQYQKVVQGLYTDLNKPIWDKHNKQAKEAADAIKKIDDQLESVRDRLAPVRAATKRLTAEKKLLKEGLDAGRVSLEEYQLRLQQLDDEYKENTRATSDWAKWTEGALDRVDGAFADAWRNIGDGFDGFRDSLTNAFKQMLAELAHLAITRPIVMQIGAAIGIGGGSAGAGLMSLGGGAGGSGGSLLADAWNYGSSAYSAVTSGFGRAVMAGWNSGGLTGAFAGGWGYGSNAISGLGSTISGWGSTAAGWFGGGSAAGAGGAGFGLGQPLVTGGVGNAGFASAGGLGSPAWGSAGSALTGVGGALYGYGQSGWKGAVTGGAGAYIGAALGSMLGPLGTALGGALGGWIGGSLFGGKWQTKDVGIALGINSGELTAQEYEFQKKKGGLLSSSKKRTRFYDLDPETAAALQQTFDATEAGVAYLFESLSYSVEEGALDGLQLARKKISTKGKTEEEIQEAIIEWFGSAADAMTAELNEVFSTGLDLDFEGMQAFVGNLQGVNEVLRYLDVGMYDASVAGGRLAEALSAAAGGLDALAANSATYYSAFFSEAEKVEDTIDSIKRAFESADVELASSREAYRAMVEDIDLTTEAGQEMFATLMALSGQAAQYYSIIEQQAAEAQAAAFELQAALITALRNGITGAVDASMAALQRSIAAQQADIRAAMTDTSAAVTALSGISNSLNAALKRLAGTSDTATRAIRAQAVMTLNSALVTARAGGSLAGIEGLQDALDVASQMDTALYGSLEEFEREQGRTANLVAELEKVNGAQLSAEKRALQMYEQQLDALDDQLKFAQDQLDALNGIDNSVGSVADAVAAMNLSVVAALSTLADGLAQLNTSQNNGTIVDTLYRAILGREADDAGRAYWMEQLQSGQLDYDQIAVAIGNAAVQNPNESAAGQAAAGDYLASTVQAAYQTILGRAADQAGVDYWVGQLQSGAIAGDQLYQALANGALASSAETEEAKKRAKQWLGIPAFASGGFHAGGLRLVGERGPELEVTGPSRIYNASQTAAMLGGAGSTEELRALRGEVAGLRSALGAIAKYTESTAYGVRQMNEIGLPQGEAA